MVSCGDMLAHNIHADSLEHSLTPDRTVQCSCPYCQVEQENRTVLEHLLRQTVNITI